AGNTCEVLASDVSLTTEIELTPGVRLQSNSSLTMEQTIGRGFTVAYIEATFQDKHSLKAIAQVFSTFETPTVTFADAINKTSALSINIDTVERAVNFLVTDTAIKNTVQRD